MTKGSYTVRITNLGQVNLTLQLGGMDANGACHYNFNPSQITIPAGQERTVKLDVLPTMPLSTKDARTHPFTVTVQPPAIPGFSRQVQGEWVHIPPEIDISLHKLEHGTTSEGNFSVGIRNTSTSNVTVHWEASGQDPDCRYTFTPSQSTVAAGEEHRVQLKVTSNTSLPINTSRTHTFTVTARLASAPKLTWQIRGEWVRTASQEITVDQTPAPSTSNPRKVWGCLVMIIGVALTLGAGFMLGNIVYDEFRFGETETWIIVIIAWITGIVVTRSVARKITKG
jgi:uncharacterized membrane protein